MGGPVAGRSASVRFAGEALREVGLRLIPFGLPRTGLRMITRFAAPLLCWVYGVENKVLSVRQRGTGEVGPCWVRDADEMVFIDPS